MNNIQMKNSGIDWIGDIPSHWEIKKLKNIAVAITGITYSPDNVVNDNTLNSILVLRSSNIQKSKISFEDNVFVNLNISKKYKTKVGDILICSRNGSRHLLGKNIIIDKSGENLTFGAFTTVLRSKYNKYIQYFLSSGVFNNILNASSSTINQLTIRDLNNVEITFPPLEQQIAIANYLDIATSKIDKKISILEQKFDKLDEYKQSVIFETVTKGLDRNVAMKNSGIDWISDIPSHWQVKRVKDIFTLKKGKNSGLYSADFIHDSVNKGTFPVYSGQTENNGIMGSINTFEYNYSQGILFTTTVGAKAMTVKRLFNEFSLSQNCGLLIPIKPVNLDYSYYLISACFSFVKQSIPSHMQPSLRKEDLSSFYCLDIPLKEQEQIVSYLNEIVSKIDYKKSIIKKQIELLKEYKQSVIFEAVTGKLEIQ